MSKLIAKHRRLTSVVVSVSTAILLTGSAFVPVASAALTEAQIQSILSLLQSFGADQSVVNNVDASLRGQATSGTTPSAGACSFTRDITIGVQGDDVKCLQDYLTGTGHFSFSGGSTGYFGSITQSATAAWQAANGVAPAVGYFGPISTAKYNSLVATAPSTPSTPGAPVVTPVGSGLTVSAGIQPVASLFPTNSTRVPFTVVNFTASSDGDVTVNSITVERTGLANDAAFSGVVLLDDQGTQVGISKTLNSTHQTSLTEDFVVKAGQTKTMVIGGNAQTSDGGYGGQIAYLSVVSVAANASVNGTFPMTGAGHTVNETLTIGTVSTVARGPLDPGSSQTKEVGTTAYTFSSVKFTAGSAEDIYVKYMRWYQSGSASKDDLANVMVTVNGTSYTPTVSADGKYYTTVFTENAGKGVLIAKGFSKEFSIKGDVAGGSLRTIDFDIQKRTDVAFNGNLYGYGITPPFGAGTTADAAAFRTADDPYYDAAQVTISAGTMNVSVNNVLAPAQNIAINLANQPLGAFTVDVKGEDISVAALHFNVHLEDEDSGEDADDITSVSLYDENGAVIAGPVDGKAAEGDASGAAGTATGEIQFTDTITFPVGVHSYILKGKISTDMDNDDTVAASTTPSGWGTVTGLVTGTTITPTPSSAITMSVMTIKAGSLTVSVSSVPIAQTVIAGASQFHFASYILDGTSSGEDIRVTSLPIENNGGAGASATDLTSCKVYDGGTVINSSNIKNPSSFASNTNFILDGSGITLTKGTSKTLDIKCDVSASAAANETHSWGIDGAEDDNFTGATGLTSGQTITETFNDSAGQTMTVAAGGSLTVSLDAGSPNYKIVNSGATGVELARIKFVASNEDINLRQVALQLTNSASSSRIDLVSNKVTLWDTSGNPVGEATFPTSVYATSSVITGFTVPKDGAKVMIVKGDIAGISNSGPLTASGDLLAVDYDGDNEGTNGNYGVGAASGVNITPANNDTAASGVRINDAYPTMARVNISSTLTNGVQPVMRWSVTAVGGDVGVKRFSLKFATTSIDIDDLNIYVFSDSGFGNAVSVSGRGDGKWRNTDQDIAALAEASTFLLDVTDSSNATTTFTIPSGATRYFEARVNVTNANATGDSLSSQLLGDAAYPAIANTMAQATTIDADTNNEFIWSPLSTTSAAIANFDWTNGYQIEGLPSSNMTPQVLSK